MQPRVAAFLVLLVSFTVIYSSVAFYLFSPTPAQSFMGFGVLSNQGTLSQYVPGSGLGVTTNQTLSWHLQVLNRMGTVQFVRLVFRLGNLTTTSPTDSGPADSLPQVGSAERFIANQDTASLNFTWKVVNATQAALIFLKLQVNSGSPGWIPLGSATGRDFRVIFELWTYDPSSNSFQYGWKDGNTWRGTFLQVWFDFVP